ncbi:MAG: cardiolipin synthase B, partial [Massilia sp.]
AHIERGILDGVPVRAEDFAGIGWIRRASYGLAYMMYKLVMRVFAIGYA